MDRWRHGFPVAPRSGAWKVAAPVSRVADGAAESNASNGLTIACGDQITVFWWPQCLLNSEKKNKHWIENKYRRWNPSPNPGLPTHISWGSMSEKCHISRIFPRLLLISLASQAWRSNLSFAMADLDYSASPYDMSVAPKKYGKPLRKEPVSLICEDF